MQLIARIISKVGEDLRSENAINPAGKRKADENCSEGAVNGRRGRGHGRDFAWVGRRKRS
jgi:hypothetical protein